MFDEIYIDNRVITDKDVRCPKCNELVKNVKWQTKSFYNAMEDYFLTDVNGEIRLLKLESPHDKTFWREYTDEEIEEWNEKLEENNGKNEPLYDFLKTEKGDGEWDKAAYYPQNRISKSMGDLPHQIVHTYAICKCDEFVELKIKFTDGLAVQIERQ